MANSDKDIKITPNTDSANLPKIEFTGQDNATKTLSVANSGALSFDGDLTVSNLTVSGSTTTINTETLTVDDNIIVLNNNESGTPSENAGIEVERGTSTNTLIRWNESADRWEFTNDGSTYYNIPISSEYATGDITGVSISAGTGISVSQSNTGSGDYTATITNSAPNVAFAVGDITGATALTSGLASTDELILSDGGVLKRMDVSVIEDYMQNNLTFTTNTVRPVTAGGNTLATGETLAFTAGTGISITESGGAVTITNSVTDTIRPITAGGNTLASNETLAFTAGSNITITESGGAVTINSTDTDTNTFRTVEVDTNGDGSANNTLTASETLRLKKGSNITLAETDGVVTISSTDTNTVYTHPNHSGDVTSSGDGATTIANDAVTYAKMQDLGTANRVLGGTSTGTISEVQVATDMIAADAITGAKIADDAIDSEHITDGSVDNVHLAGSITNSKLSNPYITINGSDISLGGSVTTPNTNDDVSNANLLTRLAALESSSGAANENITIGTDAGDTIVITGNLQVSGTTTTIDSTTVALDDHNIVLDKGNSTSAVVDGAGFTIEGGSGDDVTFQWLASGTKMELKKGSSYANLKAGTIEGSFTGDLTGNADTVTTNANLTGDITSSGNATSIASGVIVNADINASAAIAYSKLNLTGAIVNADLASGVDASKLTTGTMPIARIGTGTITTAKIGDDQITNATIADDAVRGSQISGFSTGDATLTTNVYSNAGETGNILVNSNNGFPEPGVIKVNNEVIKYKTINSDGRTLDGCIRGYRGTTAAGHNANDSVTVLLGKKITVGAGTGDNGKEVQVNPFVGADSSDAGKAGLVPEAGTGDANKYLRGDGSWQTISSGTTPNDSTVTLTAGNGLTGGGTFTTDQSSNSSVSFAVGVDDSSIEINSDALRVKASGITNAMLGGSIANAKLANSAITLTGDSGTNQTVSLGDTLDIAGGTGISTTVGATDTVTVAIDAAQTGITSLLATDIKIGEDDQTKIDFETADEIHFYAANAEQVYVADGIFGPQTDSDVDLGSTSVRWKDAFVDSITVTGEVDGASLDISGNADIDGTLEADAITIGGTAIAAAGTTSITTLGTITTGTWNGTAIAQAYIADQAINEAKLQVSNAPTNGYVLTAQSGNTGGLTWASISSGASDIDGLSDAKKAGTDFTDSLIIGHQTTGTLSSASDNTAVGIGAMDAITSGWSNTIVGKDAGTSLTTAHNATLIGKDAGKNITTSAYTTMIGVGGGSSNTVTGNYNTSVGYNALRKLSSGHYNLAIGHNALTEVNSSNYNLGIGYQAGKEITTGTRNLAIGHNALDNADTESDNLAIGYDALGGTVDGAELNVVIGNYAGDAITSGDGNTLLGYVAGGALTTGQYNIAIGTYSGDALTTGSGNVVIGRQDPASNTGDNQLVIGNGRHSGDARTWILGNDSAQINSKVNVVAVSSNTTLTNVDASTLGESGAIIYWTGGTLTLPYNATPGTQYTIINNTGSAAKPDLNSNGDFLNGTHGNIDDKDSRSYICVASANTGGGSPDWWGIG